MSQRTRTAAVCVVLVFMLVLSIRLVGAAELRTSSGGQLMVRQTSYQEPFETVEGSVLDEFTMDRTTFDPGMGSGCDVGCQSSCWGDCGASCAPCCPQWTFWGSFEFLLWWQRGREVPPLVTTGSQSTPTDVVGSIGLADTEILYGSEALGVDARPGGRLTFGAWFDACQMVGVGCRLYSLGTSETNYRMTSDTIPILTRPFTNITLGREDSDVVTYPNASIGGIAIQTTARVGGGDVFWRRMCFQDACQRVDFIAGYQFARIDQDLRIQSNRTIIARGGTIARGTVILNEDLFDTQNEYHAGEIGLMAEYDRGLVTWNLLAKVGLGRMSQRTQIAGSRTTTVPGQSPVAVNQGLYALDTNSGTYEESVFTVSPEIGLNVSYHLHRCLTLNAGYSFILWNHVAQPGDQIDLSINTTQVTGNLMGEPRPAFPNLDSSYSLHGLNMGLTWVW